MRPREESCTIGAPARAEAGGDGALHTGGLAPSPETRRGGNAGAQRLGGVRLTVCTTPPTGSARRQGALTRLTDDFSTARARRNSKCSSHARPINCSVWTWAARGDRSRDGTAMAGSPRDVPSAHVPSDLVEHRQVRLSRLKRVERQDGCRSRRRGRRGDHVDLGQRRREVAVEPCARSRAAWA